MVLAFACPGCGRTPTLWAAGRPVLLYQDAVEHTLPIDHECEACGHRWRTRETLRVDASLAR